jgi:hypothetical protein
MAMGSTFTASERKKKLNPIGIYTRATAYSAPLSATNFIVVTPISSAPIAASKNNHGRTPIEEPPEFHNGGQKHQSFRLKKIECIINFDRLSGWSGPWINCVNS